MTTKELKEYVEANGLEKLLDKFPKGFNGGIPDDNPRISTALLDLHIAYVSFKDEEAYFTDALRGTT